MGFEPPKPAVMPVRDEDHDAFGEDLEEHPRVHPTGLTPVASPVHPAGLLRWHPRFIRSRRKLRTD